MTAQNQSTPRSSSESCNTMGGYGFKELSEDLRLANNGYLFAPSRVMLAVARQYPETFSVSGGLIYRKGMPPPPQYRPEDFPAAPRKLIADDLDYEAMILNRQSEETRND